MSKELKTSENRSHAYLVFRIFTMKAYFKTPSINNFLRGSVFFLSNSAVKIANSREINTKQYSLSFDRRCKSNLIFAVRLLFKLMF